MRHALALILACTLAALGAATRGAPAVIQPLKEAADNQQSPAIVSNGATFLLAWTDEGRKLAPAKALRLARRHRHRRRFRRRPVRPSSVRA